MKWSWIGLGASLMLQGQLDAAQHVWKQGVALMGPGPTLYAYRGECYRRQGAIDLARRDLTTAAEQDPTRLSARINQALLEGDAALLASAAAECERLLPLLMETLQGSPDIRLEGVLEAMRGNRSSSTALISYHLSGRLWRLAS